MKDIKELVNKLVQIQSNNDLYYVIEATQKQATSLNNLGLLGVTGAGATGLGREFEAEGNGIKIRSKLMTINNINMKFNPVELKGVKVKVKEEKVGKKAKKQMQMEV